MRIISCSLDRRDQRSLKLRQAQQAWHVWLARVHMYGHSRRAGWHALMACTHDVYLSRCAQCTLRLRELAGLLEVRFTDGKQE